MIGLAAKIDAIDESLDAGGFPHAFGGALALAYCTTDPRATADIDLNVFVHPAQASEVFASLPDGVIVGQRDVERARRDGQVRLWWGETPVDLFFAYHRFHGEAAQRTRRVPFGEREIPVLDCTDLAILKAIFGRGRDWVDLDAMTAAESWDPYEALGWVEDLLGTDSDAYRHLAQLAGRAPNEHGDDAYRQAFGRPDTPNH